MTAPQAIEPDRLGGVNLADPATFATGDLSGLWRRLRVETPVLWHPAPGKAGGFWVLSRYDDIVAVYRDDKRFLSGRGNILDTLLHGGDSAGGRMLAVTDGKRHRSLRSLLLKAFSPRALRIVVERLNVATGKLVREAVRAGECDFARDVAEPIPLATICDLLDVPDADRRHILELTKTAHGSDGSTEASAQVWQAVNEILTYFARLARTRRGSPHADVVALLANGEIDGRTLAEDEVILNCYSLILGGNETTRLSMIGGVLALTAHPDQWEALRRGEVGMDTAVEEILRWTSPTMYMARTAASDVDLHGTRIRAGDAVTLWNVSANHDELAFDHPERFDLARRPNNHVTFGYGPHFCIGAHLSRLELTALFDLLRKTVKNMAVTGPAQRVRSSMLTGYESLPIRMVPA